MKRKSLTLTICILTILSLASIGFASWIIINPTPIEPTVGEIAVDDVTSEVFTIETAWDTTSNGKINYGKPVGYVDEDGKWLTSTAEEEENLQADLVISFIAADNVDLSGVIDGAPIPVNFKTLKNGELMEDSVETEFYQNLTLPMPVLQVKNSDGNFVAFDGFINSDDIDSNKQCTIRVVFGWGTATGNKNPYEYYNGFSFGADSGLLDENDNPIPIQVAAEDYLTKLFGSFQDVSYIILFQGQEPTE